MVRSGNGLASRKFLILSMFSFCCSDHLKSCRLSHTKQREAAGEIKNMRERMKCFLEQSAIAPGIEGNSKNATGAKDDDDADSVDSLASGGIDCDECDM